MSRKITSPTPETTAIEPTQRGPASQVQIDALNQSRPHPEAALHYTPQGPVVDEVRRQAINQKNAEIDQQIEDFRQRMAAQQDKARDAFQLAANYRGGRNL